MKFISFILCCILLFSCKSMNRINYTKNGQKQGKWLTMFPGDLKIMEETNYKDGLKHGRYRKYYENGKIAVKGNYSKDKKNKKWTIYRPNGSKSKITIYKMDKVLSNEIFTPNNF